jgi:hypothetical protein
MKYLRSYTGADGETHFDNQETELAPLEFIPGMPLMDVSAATPTKAAVFASLQAGWYGDYHPHRDGSSYSRLPVKRRSP